METFETKLSRATAPDIEEILGAIALAIDSKGDLQVLDIILYGV
jgi:hypothetical protein